MLKGELSLVFNLHLFCVEKAEAPWCNSLQNSVNLQNKYIFAVKYNALNFKWSCTTFDVYKCFCLFCFVLNNWNNQSLVSWYNKMAHELQGILYSNVHPVSGGPYQIASRGEESFLKDVITPIYNVMRRVTVVLFHCITLCFLLTIL